MEENKMTYAGLTTADKGVLLDAKAAKQKWVTRDANGRLSAYPSKPTKMFDGMDMWIYKYKRVSYIDLDKKLLQFIQWSDTEPVNIDLALAQIAEMESAEKSSGCDVCRGVKILSGTFHGVIRADDETQMEVDSDGDVDFDFCPVCGKNLNSPYTEGETK